MYVSARRHRFILAHSPVRILSAWVAKRMASSLSSALPSSSTPLCHRRQHHCAYMLCCVTYLSCTEKSSLVSSSSQLSSHRCVFVCCAPTSSSFAQSSTYKVSLMTHISCLGLPHLLLGSPQIHHPLLIAPPAFVVAVVVICPALCFRLALRCLSCPLLRRTWW
jgi:hypothetical protein